MPLALLFSTMALCISIFSSYSMDTPTSPSDEEIMNLETVFKDPPREYRMLQIIHPFPENLASSPYKLFGQQFEAPLGGEHSGQSAVTQLVNFLDHDGYGGVVANVSFNQYLENEEAWKVFIQGVRECKEKGLTVWLYDEKGYPSGKAGGITMRDHPEYECQGVVCAKTVGNKTILHRFPTGERYINGPLSVIAFPQADGPLDLKRSITLPTDLYAGKNEISWQAPDDADWVILSFHNRYMYEGTHIVTNLSDNLPYIDIMNREAVARFLEVTHLAYHDRLGGDLWSHVRAIFTDEPSLMTGYLKEDEGLLPPIPWSHHFVEEFKRREGYDPLTILPLLFEDCGEDTAYARMDFWRVISQLIEENYYGQIQEWCQAHGIASSGHTLLEEGIRYHTIFEGNLYRDLRRQDIPGIDILSSNPEEQARSQQVQVPKFVSSVAHIIGAKRCQSETSSHVQHVNKLPCSFEQRVGTINWMYVQGLNLVTSYYSPAEFNDSQRKIFNDHIGRLGAVLTQGQHVAGIAVYYPIQSLWGACTPTTKIAWHPSDNELERRVNQIFGETSQHLLASQRDYDYLDDQAILDAVIEDGALKLQGESFRCIVLPETWAIPLPVYQKMAALVEAGGALVTVGGLPRIADRKEDTPAVVALSDQLKVMERVAVRDDKHGMVEALGQLIPADLSLGQPCPDLFYCHRQTKGKDIYFLANNGGAGADCKVTFKSAGKVQKWHPATGEVQDLASSENEGKTALDLKFQPFEGYFVVFNR